MMLESQSGHRISTPVSIRPLRVEDIGKVVPVHLEAFPDSFLSLLGQRCLYCLFRGFAEYEYGVCLVAVEDDQVLGIVAGSIDQSKFYAWLFRKHRYALAIAVALAALRAPRTIPRLLRILRNPKGAKPSTVPAVLMTIAVHPSSQRRGIGKRLTSAFLKEMRRHSVRNVSLTTDRDNNDTVNAFYQHFGFKLARDFITPEGRHMNEYVIDITNEGNAPVK